MALLRHYSSLRPSRGPASACCKVLEDELQGLRDHLAKEVLLHQEQEEDVKAREAVVEGREAKLKKSPRVGGLLSTRSGFLT